MEKHISRYVFRNTMLRYIIVLVIYAGVMLTLTGVAYFIMMRTTWYDSDALYPILHFAHENFALLAIIGILGGAFIISIIFFYRIARRMEILMKEEQSQKADMIMYMAHDLRTPLTSVLGYLRLLNDAKDMPADIREHYTDIVLKKAMRLEYLINEFFEVTRMGSAETLLSFEPVNFYRMIEQLAYEFKPILDTKELTYELSGDKDIFVKTDAEKMVRVVENLLKNAVNYSYPKTAILIDINKKDKSCVCTITNEGQTIPPEKLSHIFERFYRIDDDDNGTGLGLVIVKQMVELHGGSVICESEDEKVRFILTLPLYQKM